MDYHLDGFRPGDPSLRPPAGGSRSTDEVDVLIVGCGPAGLTLATQMSAFGELNVRIVDQKLGPLEMGQADGVACRSMEMFEAFGFADRVAKEAYWVNETVFWRPDPNDASRIARADRIQDVEDGLSESPHVILSQARIHDFFLESMAKSPARLSPDYGRRFVDLTVDPEVAASPNDKPAPYPVEATLERVDPGHEGEIETVRARYVVGCDGARSAVRSALGVTHQGDVANKLWGVIDVLAVTDFPDIRLKSAIQSAADGSVLVIPREGGYLVRLYTELGELEPGERAADRNLTADDIIEAAGRVFQPYTLDVKEVVWWSAYEIGQRLTDSFDNTGSGSGSDSHSELHPRVFITGDACHTHSPKAGQGMNVSMADSFNLGWKLAAVLLGRASPELLTTYSTERRAVAKELIDFDREMEKLFVTRAEAEEGSASGRRHQAEFQRYFTKHARFTAGVETRYEPSLITGPPDHQRLAAGFAIGTRFHSAPVTRLGDAKSIHLGHVLKADGRWRLLAFADISPVEDPASQLHRLCSFLGDDPDSPVCRHTPAGANIDSVIDVRAVVQQPHREVAVDRLPPLLLPPKGKLGLRDYEKVFCPAVDGPDIFDLRGVDRAEGALLVIRPDQHVAHILPLDAGRELSEFFARFLLPAP